jgi:YVTN family beta-propeller protein
LFPKLAFIVLLLVFFTNGYGQSGLVSYWPADGNSFDIAGSNNATNPGGAVYAPGKVGQAFSLNGSNYIQVPDSPSVSLTGPFTLSAWIKLNTNSVQQAIIEKYDVPGLNGYLLRIINGKLWAAICDPTLFGANHPAFGATTVTTGVWHHVAAVYDGTTISVYLDGQMDGSAPTTVVPSNGSTSLKFGARGDDANTRLNGLIDDVKIFNRALTAMEIQSLQVITPSQNRAYIANQATNSVEVMDLSTNALISNISVGQVPAHLAVNSADE